MDNLCHSLMGAALGRAGLARRTALGMATLVIANNLPDVDVAVFATDTLPMAFRRGWTHGVLAQLTLPLALTAVIVGYDWLFRRRVRLKADTTDRRLKADTTDRRLKADTTVPSDRVKPLQVLLLSYVGVMTHVFMDFLNSYGVRVLMPFSERWFYGDALYIVDPWMYLALGVGWWWSRRREVRHQPQPERPARIGLAVATGYMLVMLASNLVARAEVRGGLTRAGRPADTRFMVTPVFANPFRREVIIDVGDRYERGHLWFEPLPHFRPAGFGLETGMHQPDVQPLVQTPTARAFLRWSRFPFVQVEPGPPPSVWINDYRYSSAGPYGWSATKLQ